MRRRLLAALLMILPASVSAEGCGVLQDGSDPWDQLDQIVDVRSMTVMTVVRFDSTRRRGTVGAKRQKWTDDVPSDTMGAANICDRVQLESAYPLDGAEDLPIAMLQGERLNQAVDLVKFPDLKLRLESDERLVITKPGPAYLTAVDLSARDWRPDLFAQIAKIGEVDERRWMIGLPGGLYIVPLKP